MSPDRRIGERHLSAEEVAKYLRAVKERDVVEETYFSLLILYGARPGELAQWRWDWIREDRITVPGEYQKNGKPLILPLTPGVQKALVKLGETTGHTAWLFPNPDETAARQSFRKNKGRLEKKMELKEPWTLRDIRRTTETLLRELKTPPEVVSVILNHNTSQLRKIYEKSMNVGEKRRALIRYEQHLNRLESREDKGKVVDITSYRGA